MLSDLGAQLEALSVFLAAYGLAFEATRKARAEVYRAMRADNPIGATAVDALLWRQAVREVGPSVVALGVVPLVVVALFAPPALEIVSKIDPEAPYDPLRAAFVAVEAGWAAVAVFMVRGMWRYRRFAQEVEQETARRVASQHQADLQRAAQRRADEAVSRRAGEELYGYRPWDDADPSR